MVPDVPCRAAAPDTPSHTMVLTAQYNAELAHGIINADLDTNVSELHCDNLAGKKDEESQISVSLVNSEALEATLQEWKVGDVLVASHLWGCSFQENKPQQAVYMKVQSLHRSASIPNGIDMMVKRAMLTVVMCLPLPKLPPLLGVGDGEWPLSLLIPPGAL